MSYRWVPIEDCESRDELAHRELAALADVWREQRARLRNQQSYLRFERRLRREWQLRRASSSVFTLLSAASLNC